MTEKRLVTVQDTRNNTFSGYLRRVLQLLALLNTVILFLSGLNPARITGYIGKSVSLFTCGVSWGTLTQNMGRALSQGWISRSNAVLLFVASSIVILAAALGVVSACMSLGNLKLKNKGIYPALAGGILELVGCVSILAAYKMIQATGRPDKVNPEFPYAVILYLVMGSIIVLVSVVQLLIQPKAPEDMVCKMDAKYKLFLMFLPVVVLAFLFSYLPLLGWRYAFFDYKAGEQLTLDNFVGLKWFTQLFQNRATRNDVVRVLRNTLAMSGLGIVTSWLPMAFAIFLSEIKNNKFRRFIQTLTTIPAAVSRSRCN